MRDSSTRYRATTLAELLDKNERSQSWLARKLGVSVTLMHYMVKGERTMSAGQAEIISELFGIPLFLFCESTDATISVTDVIR